MKAHWLVVLLIACGDKKPNGGTEPCGPGWDDYDLGSSALYVDVTAEPGGDGSQCHPYLRISDALEVSGSGGTVAIAGGTYMENLAIEGVTDQLRIVGHGRDEVIIDGSEGQEDESTVLISESDDVRIEGLTITGAPYVGLTIEGAGVDLLDVTVTANSWIGVAIRDVSDVWMDGVEISETLPLEEGAGYGLTVVGASVVSGGALRVVDNTTVGIALRDLGTTLTLGASEISRTQGFDFGYGEDGFGVLVFDGATMILNEDTILDGNHGTSIDIAWAAAEEGKEPEPAVVTLDHVIIFSTERVILEDGTAKAVGVSNSGGSLTMVEAVTISDSAQGVYLDGAYGATADISGLTVNGSDGAAWGVAAVNGATITLSDSTVAGPFSFGVWVDGRGSSASLSSTSVLGCAPTDGLPCLAVAASARASLDIDGGEIAGAAGYGLAISDRAEASASGLTIRDTIPVLTSTGTMGAVGAYSVSGARLTLSGSVLEGNAVVGASADNGGELTLDEGTEIRDTWAIDAAIGLLAFSDDGSTTRVEASGGLITGTGGVGAAARGGGASLVLSNLEILDGVPGGYSADEGAAAIYVESGGVAELTGVRITRQVGTGVWSVGTSDDGLQDSEVDAVRCTISDVYSVSGAYAVGVYTDGGGSFIGDRLSVSKIEGPALYGVDGLVGCIDCKIQEVEFAAGVGQAGSVIGLYGTSIDATGADYGIWASSDYNKNALVLGSDSSITGPFIAAVAIKGEGYYLIQDSELGTASGVDSRGTLLNGNAIFASGISTPWDEDTGEGDSGAGLYIAGNDLHDNAGPAVLLLDSTATIGCNDWSNNLVDLVCQGAESAGEPTLVDCTSSELTTDLDPTPSYGYSDPDSVEFVFEQRLTLPELK